MSSALLWLVLATTYQAPDTLVVCPTDLRAALAPWLEYRGAQGHRIEVIPSSSSALELRAAIRKRARVGVLKWIVLVGDTDSVGNPSRTVPTFQAPAKVTLPYGSEPTIASDNGYADLDDDQLPDVAIGRLSVDSSSRLAALVQKVLAYERNTDYGAWRRRVSLVAGIGGFGALADAAVEAAARQVITAGIPPAYSTRITYGSWRSPYFPDPRRFQATTIDSLCEGSLCWVYLGHAWPHQLADLHVPGGSYPSIGTRDLPRMQSRHGAPIACLLACYAGAFDAPRQCLAEGMLVTPGGPVAVIGGSRVTMPYAMAVLGSELLDELFQHQPDTLGEALLHAKRNMVVPQAKSATRLGLDALATLLGPGSLKEELVEHLHLFNLLGDPLLRLQLPQEASLTAPETTRPGERIRVRGSSPIAGRATLELVPRRDLLTFKPAARREFAAGQFADYDATYARANDACYARVSFDVPAGEFARELIVPAAAQGPCHVRLYVEGRDGCAAGAVDLKVSAVEEPRSEAATYPAN